MKLILPEAMTSNGTWEATKELPDEAFAVVDNEHFTTTIRLFPHHDADGNLSVFHCKLYNWLLFIMRVEGEYDKLSDADKRLFDTGRAHIGAHLQEVYDLQNPPDEAGWEIP